MKKLIASVLLAGGLVACNTVEQRAVGGGLIGAGTGAVIGGVATGTTGGALAGAAIGGVGGAAIGAATAPVRRGRTCRGYDDFGNPVRVAC
jgi:hypothetical protein